MRKQHLHPSHELPDDIYDELVGILYASPQSVLCVLSCAMISALYVAANLQVHIAWIAAGFACLACLYRGWTLFAYPYRRVSLPSRLEAKNWAWRYGAGTVAQNLSMTSVIAFAFSQSPSLAAVPFGWAMATSIGSLSRTAGVLWIPVTGAVTLLMPMGFAALLHPSTDAKLCGAFALVNLYAAVECAKYLHSSFVGRLIAERTARHQASYDALTGLSNRRIFDLRMAELCARGTPIAVLALDLDGFKPVNDAYGHAAGDAVLCEVATRLKQSVGSAGLVARTGGDEFCVLVYDPLGATGLASAIVRSLGEPVSFANGEACIGVSIGLARGEGVNAMHLLRAADDALYRAKREGRGRYEIAQAA